jgi:hypothetical protein
MNVDRRAFLKIPAAGLLIGGKGNLDALDAVPAKFSFPAAEAGACSVSW